MHFKSKNYQKCAFIEDPSRNSYVKQTIDGEELRDEMETLKLR